MEFRKYIPSLHVPIGLARYAPEFWLTLTSTVVSETAIGTHYMPINLTMTVSLAGALTIWIHIICSSIWVGGSIFLGIVLAPALKSITSNAEERLLLMIKFGRRFNNLAIPSFAILIGTGIYNARTLFANPETLLLTQYGQILLIKIILVVAVTITYVFHVMIINKETERKLGMGQTNEVQIIKLRSRIIRLGRITVILSISVLFLASLLGSGGF